MTGSSCTSSTCSLCTVSRASCRMLYRCYSCWTTTGLFFYSKHSILSETIMQEDFLRPFVQLMSQTHGSPSTSHAPSARPMDTAGSSSARTYPHPTELLLAHSWLLLSLLRHQGDSKVITKWHWQPYKPMDAMQARFQANSTGQTDDQILVISKTENSEFK